MPITITSKKHLFRRCGVPHPAQPTEYPDGQFTDAQLEILKADHMLIVEIIETTENTENTEGKEGKEEALRDEELISVNSVASVVKKSKKG